MRNVISKYHMDMGQETLFPELIVKGVNEIYCLDDGSVITIGHDCPDKSLPDDVIDKPQWDECPQAVSSEICNA